MFSVKLSYVLEAALREAVNRRHGYFCMEHILYAMLFDDEIENIILHCGGDTAVLKKDVEEYFDNALERETDIDLSLIHI